MRETFDRFDRNGSGELNLEEYKKAWKFLGRPGSDKEIEEGRYLLRAKQLTDIVVADLYIPPELEVTVEQEEEKESD